MRESLARLLICPACRGRLTMSPTAANGEDVEEGVLSCGCGAVYEILGSVPRFVPSDGYADTFSFQWLRHRRTQLDTDRRRESEETFRLSTGLTLDELSGRLVLDVGCGMGRFSDVVVRAGAETIGVDLSYAIDAAQANVGASPTAHFVQADLFRLPFANETFDCIFSIGVLHHTADCRRAVAGLVRYLKPGGVLAVWVYPRHKLHGLAHAHPERFSMDSPYVLRAPFRMGPRTLKVFSRVAIWIDEINNRWNAAMRAVARRLPTRMLYALCHLAVPLYHVLKYRPFAPLRLFVKISMHPDPRWRVLDTFDNLSARYQSRHTPEEVSRWFTEGGLEDIRLLPNLVAVRGRRPRR